MLVIQEVEHMRITHTQIHTHAHTLTHVHTHKHLFCANESYHTCEGAYLQCIAVCCSIMSRAWMLRISAVFCSVLQCVAVCCSVLQRHVTYLNVAHICSVLQCVVVYCSVMSRTWMLRISCTDKMPANTNKQRTPPTKKKSQHTNKPTHKVLQSFIEVPRIMNYYVWEFQLLASWYSQLLAFWLIVCERIRTHRSSILCITRITCITRILTHCVRAH